MATTGELRAIMQELHLVEIGDAASYLGDETMMVEEISVSKEPVTILVNSTTHLATCDCISCQVLQV